MRETDRERDIEREMKRETARESEIERQKEKERNEQEQTNSIDTWYATNNRNGCRCGWNSISETILVIT